MKLEEIFTRFSVSDEVARKRVAFLLASFGCLYEDENQDDYVSAYDIDYIDNDELGEYEVSDYDFESGCYLNGRWFSLENIIGALSEFDR